MKKKQIKVETLLSIEDEFKRDFKLIPNNRITHGDIIELEVFALDLRDGSDFLITKDHNLLRLIESGHFLFGIE